MALADGQTRRVPTESAAGACQLHVLQRSRSHRVRLTPVDRFLWVWLPRAWTEWRAAIVIVKPETVIAWHRQGFRLFWTWKSRCRSGRPTVPADVRSLILTLSRANPLWGAPRIHGELMKLGIEVSQSSVAKYLVRRQQPPSQTWRTFLGNHITQIVAADFFVVPTVTYPSAVRPRDPRARPPTCRARGRHGTSDGGVDGPTAPRSVPVERASTILAPRSRPRVRRLTRCRQSRGDTRRAHGTAFAVAQLGGLHHRYERRAA